MFTISPRGGARHACVLLLLTTPALAQVTEVPTAPEMQSVVVTAKHLSTIVTVTVAPSATS